MNYSDNDASIDKITAQIIIAIVNYEVCIVWSRAITTTALNI